ncbi:hypothetical protein [Primorskyibacter flagellatus]|uniref:DUF1795 domain-containing protein n=1 Tax=Primorskyibacter flagellatus TaxID=1387277 RepID=A0A1W2ESA2_9RHOB|nr:hypothetical protein [Primorskyibacter flagellatus]SMD12048.1 hypothetical protein SAMN06295998_1383 [Primorskyibacter flagellatus]
MLRGFCFGFCGIVVLFGMIYFASDRVVREPWQRFSNSYISFNLPPGWECNSSGTEFVCEDVASGDQELALFVLTAKQVGPMDNFDNYQAYLQTPKTMTLENDEEALQSVVEELEIREISGEDWVFSQHLNSELPAFHTQYFATVRKDVAVLVTYSYHKDAPRRLHEIGEQAATSFIILN